MRLAALLFLVVALTGCSSFGYYTQAVSGQMSVMAAARPIDEWLDDPTVPAHLKERLRTARQIREFASRELAEPDNRSYTTYADLKRSAVVWNVFATPELSMQLKTWCYPFFGCASYRGYFKKAGAERLAADLAREGFDVSVAPIPAYSTLGWLHDPLLNTFIDLPEPEIARMIFHELAHQIVYIHDDTEFNESFATAVEQEGVRRWLQHRGDPQALAQWQVSQTRRAQFLKLLTDTRQELDTLYKGPLPVDDKRAGKRDLLAQLQQRYHALRDGPWGGYAGYDRFFAQPLNNAHLAAIGAYFDRVPAFEELMRRTGYDMASFYKEVKRIGALPKAERDDELNRLDGRVSFDHEHGWHRSLLAAELPARRAGHDRR